MAKILVAEDDASVRLILEHILKREGYEVVAVSDGNDAFSELEGGAFNAVLVDVNMPGRGGLEIAADIRGTELNADTPVVVLTGSGLDDTADSAQSLGVADYLTKPVSSAKLRDTVAKVIE